jgi:hypothetical protein
LWIFRRTCNKNSEIIEARATRVLSPDFAARSHGNPETKGHKQIPQAGKRISGGKSRPASERTACGNLPDMPPIRVNGKKLQG